MHKRKEKEQRVAFALIGNRTLTACYVSAEHVCFIVFACFFSFCLGSGFRWPQESKHGKRRPNLRTSVRLSIIHVYSGHNNRLCTKTSRYTLPHQNVHLYIVWITVKYRPTLMIFCMLNPEKISDESLTDLSTSFVRCSHFNLGNPKKSFSTVLFIHTATRV